MIPRAHVTAWRAKAPWPDNSQVEQDLILSRALIDIFRHPVVADHAIFRGGTALHKLFFDPAGRYSEDIDLVQRKAGPIGELINAIREVIDPWLGDPTWKQGKGRFTLYYRFKTTFVPVVNMRLKIEINTREHFSVLGLKQLNYSVSNPWFSGVNKKTVPFSSMIAMEDVFKSHPYRIYFSFLSNLANHCTGRRKVTGSG